MLTTKWRLAEYSDCCIRSKDASWALLKSAICCEKFAKEQPYLAAQVEDSVLNDAIEEPQEVEQHD